MTEGGEPEEDMVEEQISDCKKFINKVERTIREILYSSLMQYEQIFELELYREYKIQCNEYTTIYIIVDKKSQKCYLKQLNNIDRLTGQLTEYKDFKRFPLLYSGRDENNNNGVNQ